MSERERWIVYPLLFFALGAALRDKFTQEVRTDKLRAGQIQCEELLIIDAEKPDRVVAKLTSNAPQRNQPSGDRYGVLVLIDSEGRELCGVTNNALQVNSINCQNLTVVDPLNPRQPLAVLTSGAVRQPDGRKSRVGSLLLTDDQGQSFFGLAEDQLQMRRIVCEGVAVVDPANPSRVLAGLGSLALPPRTPGGKPRRFGVLALNNERYNRIVGVPLGAGAQPRDAQPTGQPDDRQPAADPPDEASPSEGPADPSNAAEDSGSAPPADQAPPSPSDGTGDAPSA
ncbi:MAG: hypothetical protein DCC67_04865 [Planctomycetota bacterium]|nr:MAG: hypothetical protein DCC67_04865 [Planctomycetota bacterium]